MHGLAGVDGQSRTASGLALSCTRLARRSVFSEVGHFMLCAWRSVFCFKRHASYSSQVARAAKATSGATTNKSRLLVRLSSYCGRIAIICAGHCSALGPSARAQFLARLRAPQCRARCLCCAWLRTTSGPAGACVQSTVPPNPSLKRSAIGRAPGPRGCHVYHQPRGPGTLPLSPA